MKLHIKKGDTVKVISGNDKGKIAKILTIFPSKNTALVEGLNLISKHLKPSADNPKGKIEKKESSIHLSNLMLIDPSNGKPTRIYRKTNDNGKIYRYSKQTNKVIK